MLLAMLGLAREELLWYFRCASCMQLWPGSRVLRCDANVMQVVKWLHMCVCPCTHTFSVPVLQTFTASTTSAGPCWPSSRSSPRRTGTCMVCIFFACPRAVGFRLAVHVCLPTCTAFSRRLSILCLQPSSCSQEPTEVGRPPCTHICTTGLTLVEDARPTGLGHVPAAAPGAWCDRRALHFEVVLSCL